MISFHGAASDGWNLGSWCAYISVSNFYDLEAN